MRLATIFSVYVFIQWLCLINVKMRFNILLYKSNTACLFERKTVLSMGPIFSSCVENITLGIPWNLANRSFPCKLFWDEKTSQPLDRRGNLIGFSFQAALKINYYHLQMKGL